MFLKLMFCLVWNLEKPKEWTAETVSTTTRELYVMVYRNGAEEEKFEMRSVESVAQREPRVMQWKASNPTRLLKSFLFFF